ncbi:acyl-CoA dehydrogenase family protein [Gordonia terrae]|uniref:Acyl-CoA dehydrogenase n=2 Tax=Gordonia terrae TaxID=2055 RepID=A0AAD0K3X7_9ACTN|nr:acyl-CoA dehydrogenase family protein [Gordonia terrae]VTR09175.1 Acyl-CoA dehydrogenases [Clostridioides difficile]ANY21854.1 acyl-CoA dehydrogenase [Gordonia terrae]AWO82589.1 acyl-CoA dehydrogenase [Gordonia terrae]VTS22370.1 (R)-benzylsuccinyl-CoA dehydrogenase [Gordonia terrae]GAB44668.1 putative acyl-CoA dehydrogenase [Gordonia terrae NBRC 100016]
MAWDFETDPEYQEQLDWVEQFVRDEVEPADRMYDHPLDMADPVRNAIIRPLQEKVREKGLWACHLGPELGGQGYGQLKLALLNELIGTTLSGPVIFGTQAPDSGNAEILAHYGSDELKKTYLEPLLAGEIASCFSMTEPTGGSDPTSFRCRAVRDGDDYVISGEKWFSSNARFASFLIVMAVTDPDAERHRRASMFVVPSDTPGIEIVRNVGVTGHAGHEGTHAYVRYNDVRVPAANLLGGDGDGFKVAQVRLGGGRIHHAMRTVALVRRSLDAMLERAVSRETRGRTLGELQLVQEMIADSWIQLEQFRLLVLRTAWKIDQVNDYKQVIKDIAGVKVAMPKVLQDVAGRAVQLHGSLGISTELPFGKYVLEGFHMAIADGATEIHKQSVAKQLLKGVEPAPDLFPSIHVPRLRDAADTKFADVLAAAAADAAEVN